MQKEVTVNSDLPVWMSFIIFFTYFMLIVLVTVGIQRVLYLLEGKQESGAFSWIISVFLAAWLSLVVVLGVEGFFGANPTGRFPRIAYTLIPFVLGIGILFVSPIFERVVARTPPHWIIGVQTNRLLGALFLVGFIQGRLPAPFAFPAGFGDVLVGLSAPVVAYLFATGHKQARLVGMLWNIVGIIDLLVAIATGVLTSPGILHCLALNTPNLLMSTFPFVIIPAFGVPVWLLLHMFSLRGLALHEKGKM